MIADVVRSRKVMNGEIEVADTNNTPPVSTRTPRRRTLIDGGKCGESSLHSSLLKATGHNGVARPDRVVLPRLLRILHKRTGNLEKTGIGLIR